jgi:prolipoprotein diacylglyceryltransferase
MMFENPENLLYLIIFVFLVVTVAIPLALLLLFSILTGAFRFFLGALRAGTGGVLVYIALWVFLFPLMLTLSALMGAFYLWVNRNE